MDKYTAKIAMYLEDALPKAEMTELENHLAHCSICRAEHETLTQLDQLFIQAPMIAPPSDFVAKFETRLERRVHRRRTVIGVSVIGIILMLATGLLVWTLIGSGAAAWELLSKGGVLGNLLEFVGALAVGISAFIKIVTLMGRALMQTARYPAFWGYMMLATGIVTFWAQLLRRFHFEQQPVSAR